MFKHDVYPAKTIGADAVLELPIEVLLALPASVALDRRAPIPNVPGIIWNLLGRAGWQRATRVMAPRIWAPDWSDGQLLAFAKSPFEVSKRRFPDVSAAELRVHKFPGLVDDSSGTPAPSFAIVHLVTLVRQERGDIVVEAGSSAKDAIRAGALRDALVRSRTRLLILQVPQSQRGEVDRLADYLVNSGGPAVLSVIAGPERAYSEDDLLALRTGRAPLWSAGNLATVERYFGHLYANLVHQYLLSSAVPPTSDMVDLDVRLAAGSDGEQLLQLHSWIAALQARIAGARQEASEHQHRLRSVRERKARMLHRAQAIEVDRQFSATEDHVSALLDAIAGEVAHYSKELDFAHESEGVIPLSETADALADIERKVQTLRNLYPKLEAEMTRELSIVETKAPRVLNANFADPVAEKVLDARSVLQARETYHLLVDVGPRWSTIPSIVVGHADFPDSALPADREGFDVDVMFASSDFDPPLASARLWVPRQTGRSFPVTGGKRADKPGPVILEMSPVMRFDAVPAPWYATGRISLYHENNLLQSAVIKTAVASTAQATPEEDNSIEVDYALTGDFQDVPERYGRRAISLGYGASDTAGEPVRVNVTLNSDGNRGHRIIITHGFEPGVAPAERAVPSAQIPPAAIVPYDPDTASAVLDQARAELFNCFFDRTELELRRDALLADNGRSLEQFKYDLRDLALLGRRLFNIATGEADVLNAEMSAGSWTKRLNAALRRAAVIQIARTDHANYVFPWALVYAHPMPGPAYTFCKVLEEWDTNGRRRPAQYGACRYQDEPWHQENIYCPFGFWGLKHVIEQPPGAYRDLRKLRRIPGEIRAGANVTVGIGISRDEVAFKREIVASHLSKLERLDHVQCVPTDGADDIDKVRAMLASPDLVYFLCHGKVDSDRRLAFLGVGPLQDDRRYKIYASMIQDWTDTEVAPNLASWSAKHPLVFINGCHTADLEPGQLLNFVTAFARAGASGVVGTEVSVRLPVAVEVAESLITKILRGVPAGEAMWSMRWELADKGNLLGLAYTLYALADLRLSRAPAV